MFCSVCSTESPTNGLSVQAWLWSLTFVLLPAAGAALILRTAFMVSPFHCGGQGCGSLSGCRGPLLLAAGQRGTANLFRHRLRHEAGNLIEHRAPILLQVLRVMLFNHLDGRPGVLRQDLNIYLRQHGAGNVGMAQRV